MTMRSYDDIEFRPWYLPDTARWLKLSLGARGLVAELLRKLDRHGRIALGEDPASDLAVILRLDEADTREALTELLTAGRLVWDPVERLLSDPDLPARMLGYTNRLRARIRAEATRLRGAIIERDGLICYLCLGVVHADDVHIDHVRPVSRGGLSDLDNLRVTHSRCNQRKGAS